MGAIQDKNRDKPINTILTMKYSLWKVEHLSVYTVMLYKVRDTNSSKEVDKWMDESWYNAASFYRDEDEINANYVQIFQHE